MLLERRFGSVATALRTGDRVDADADGFDDVAALEKARTLVEGLMALRQEVEQAEEEVLATSSVRPWVAKERVGLLKGRYLHRLVRVWQGVQQGIATALSVFYPPNRSSEIARREAGHG